MLSHIRQLKLTADNDVIYPDGQIGSNIYDLIKYFVSDVNFSPPRPSDSKQFQKLLEAVPKSAFGRGRDNQSMTWKELY